MVGIEMFLPLEIKSHICGGVASPIEAIDTAPSLPEVVTITTMLGLLADGHH